MACPRLLGKSYGFSNGKYLFAMICDEPRHCSYTKRCATFEKNLECDQIYFTIQNFRVKNDYSNGLYFR